MRFPLDQSKTNGVTALGIAAYKGSVEIIDLLVRAGANINLTSKSGIGPLYLAIKSKKVEAVQKLVDNKACLYYEQLSFIDNSPLFFAVR